MEIYRELLEYSKENKRGLTFFIKGQAVSGIVVEFIGTTAVELRSQTYSRIILRLDSVDAVALT